MINIRGIDHVVLVVADMARALCFYRDVLGCRLEKRQPAIGLVQLRAGLALIDLLDAAATPADGVGEAVGGTGPRNMDHFCLRVEPWDEPALCTHLTAHGVTPGAVVSRYGAEGQGPSMYLADPDGNTVELKGPPQRPAAGTESGSGRRRRLRRQAP